MMNYKFRLSILCMALLPGLSVAEVIRDGSIGPDASVQATGPNFVIDETMGETAGANLFHSFSTFNLNVTESATFTATSPIDNVITRVTGDGASSLDGSLNSNISGANFFFINPNGVVFGENSAVNVDGSFHVSTGNYLRFSDDTQFSVSLGDTPGILSTASPTAFGFLGNAAPATITINQSALNFKPESQLSIIAGDITINSAESAVVTLPGGQVKIVSVASDGEVPIALNQNSDTDQTLGVVNLQGEAGIIPDVSDDDIDDAPDPLINLNGDEGGHIVIRSEQLNIHNFSIATHTLGMNSGAATGIEFNVKGALRISGNSHISSTSEGAGKAGDVLIKAHSLTMLDDAEILSDTFNSAPGGEVRLEAESILMLGDAEVGSDVEGSGDGGEVNVVATTLTLSGEAEISTDTAGTGEGGNVNINVSELVLLDQQGGIFADTQTNARAGDIVVNTPKLIVRGFEEDDDDEVDDDPIEEDGEVDDDLFEAAGIYTISASTGDAGNIDITANIVEVRDEAAIAASAVDANGGNITINADERLYIRGSGVIANVNQGVGGNIDLKSKFVMVHDSEIVAKAGTGQGGAILIESDQFFSSESVISASAGPAGISGTVTTPTKIDLTNSLVPLVSEFQDVNRIFDTECKVRGNIKKQGSFVVMPQPVFPTTQEGLLYKSTVENNKHQIPYLPALVIPEYLDKNKSSNKLEFALKLSLAARQNGARTSAYLLKSRTILDSLPDTSAKSYALLHLSVSFRMQLDNIEENLLKSHDLIRDAELIAKQQNDSRALSFALGNLAHLYFIENRIDEALLLTRQALQHASSVDGIDARYRWYWLEGQLLWANGQTDPAIAAYKRAITILSEYRLEALVDSQYSQSFFEQEVEPVYFGLVEALFASADLMGDETKASFLYLDARETIEQLKVAELRDYFNDPCIAEITEKSKNLDQLIESTAIIYPIELPDRLEILVSLPSGLKRFTVDVSREKLAQEVSRFRGSLQKVNSLLYRRHAKKLFNWLIKPIQESLQSEVVNTLVFVPGASLRPLPFSALYDGQQFLVEQYALATAPSMSLIDPKPIDRDRSQILMAGLSQEVKGFSALPGVEKELTFLENLYGSSNSQVLLNQQFTVSKVREKLADTQPGIVHIASHAEFGGKQSENFVLAYDGKINMSQLSRYIGVAKYRTEPLELIILSACDTASGDERAALGLAGISIQAGARSAMGSLWKISDVAAQLLVSGFYSELSKTNVTKADALQQAQLKLLRDDKYKHPYYWSPFLIINNWL